MKILVLGPTGRTGQQLVAQALAAGHEVTALARRSAAIEPRQGLRIVESPTQNVAALEQVIAQCDAVLCALGGSPLRRNEWVCSTAIGQVAPLMAKHGVRRVIAISTCGAGDTRSHIGWFERNILFGFILKSEVADKEAMEMQLSQTDLDWTVVRVGVLTDGDARGAWRVADDGSIRGMGKIARADVATFMLEQLDKTDWLRRRPVIMY